MAGHFIDFGLSPEICGALEELEWYLPTDIQAESIPLVMGGCDVLMAAETGTGKTGAFSVPVIQIVQEDLLRQQAAVLPTSADDGPRMSNLDRHTQLNLFDDGLVCRSVDPNNWQGCRATVGLTSGRAYFQITPLDDGLCRVGCATKKASLFLGTDECGFGFGGTGKKSHRKKFTDYGRPFGKGDVVGTFIDLVRMTISFSINGVSMGEAFQIDHQLKGSAFYPALVLKNGCCAVNFGGSDKVPPNFRGFLPFLETPPKHLRSGSEEIATATRHRASSPLALILEPSRELALQIQTQLALMSRHVTDHKPRVCTIIGGEDSSKQLRDLNGGVDILVATPNKLKDFLKRQVVNLGHVRFMILDEADALLKSDSRLIYDLCGKAGIESGSIRKMQFIICSATLHDRNVSAFADKFCPFANWIDLKGKDSVPGTVHHVVCRVDPSADMSWKEMTNLCKNDGVHDNDTLTPGSKQFLSLGAKFLKLKYAVNAINKHRMERALIFCRTKLDCDILEDYLTRLGGGPRAAPTHQFSCRCLHSDRSQAERQGNLQSFKSMQTRILICTAVAARGIDIDSVPYLICLTLPDEKSNYVHMIGRVGRAERMGLAINLVSQYDEKVWFHRCRRSGCRNTKLLSEGGCCIWINELQLLSDIEQHLMETIETIGSDFEIPVNEFDGKVTYGNKKVAAVDKNVYHTAELAPVLRELVQLEKQAQNIYLKRLLGR